MIVIIKTALIVMLWIGVVIFIYKLMHYEKKETPEERARNAAWLGKKRYD